MDASVIAPLFENGPLVLDGQSYDLVPEEQVIRAVGADGTRRELPIRFRDARELVKRVMQAELDIPERVLVDLADRFSIDAFPTELPENAREVAAASGSMGVGPLTSEQTRQAALRKDSMLAQSSETMRIMEAIDAAQFDGVPLILKTSDAIRSFDVRALAGDRYLGHALGYKLMAIMPNAVGPEMDSLRAFADGAQQGRARFYDSERGVGDAITEFDALSWALSREIATGKRLAQERFADHEIAAELTLPEPVLSKTVAPALERMREQVRDQDRERVVAERPRDRGKEIGR